KGKRVFLTGHTGFKGSWLSLWLQAMGAEVTGFSLAPNTEPSLFEAARVAEGMTSVIGDIRDLDALSAAVKAASPEIVIHMAAQPLVRESYVNPVFNYATNVMGTVHLLEGVRHTPAVKAVVIVTSDKCYENREWHWAYREESALGGEDPYSNSKACSELVTHSYRTSFFNPANFAEHGVAVASARAGNVIGGGDWAKDRLVPDALAALQAGSPLVLRNPHSTRPWQHVLEPLNGYLVLAEALFNEGPKHAEAWNFGPYEFSDRTVGWIVDRLCGLWGLEIPKHQDTGPKPHEAGYLKVDSSKARAVLGWAPKLDLETTLQWIVDWTKFYQQGGSLREFTLSQIATFAVLPAYEPGVPRALADNN
ncbi:MAG: CDP-glucose 4,6-dehydratase, partial [Verrucomicrobiaceae bacterium]